MLDPVVTAAAIGVVVSPVAGRVLLHRFQHLSEPRRRKRIWVLVGSAIAVALFSEFLLDGPAKGGVFILLLGLLPGMVAFMVWRTALASAVVSLVPLYFGIGALTLGRPLHVPEIALDRAVPLQPEWMLVYGSLYVFVFLPLLTVRQAHLFRQALKAYVLVLTVAYVGFVTYPTVAPRPRMVSSENFSAWCLRLQYSLDWAYNCFPSLHVAHSFVSALASYRVHRGVGLIAVSWASLIGVSTLFTKQHYAVDVITGVFIAYVAYVLFLRSSSREAIDERDQRLAPFRALGVVGIYGLVVALFWVLYQTGTIIP